MELRCTFCNHPKVFSSKKSLSNHSRKCSLNSTSNNIELLRCTNCNPPKEFESKRSLSNHSRYCIPRVLINPCPKMKDLNQNMCPKCNQQFQSRASLSQHARQCRKFPNEGLSTEAKKTANEFPLEQAYPTEELEPFEEEFEPLEREFPEPLEREFPVSNYSGNVEDLENLELHSSEIYLNFQNQFSDEIFGKGAFQCNEWNEIIQCMKKSTKYSSLHLINSIDVYECLGNGDISREGCDKILKLFGRVVKRALIESKIGTATIKSIFSKFMPTTWKRVVAHAVGSISNIELPSIKKVIEWPTSWRMDRWNPRYVKPNTIEIEVIDPIRAISLQFLNPSLVYAYRDHIKFEYQAEFEPGTQPREQTFGDLSSSSWFKNTEADIRQRNPHAYLLPIILYSDGVQVGVNSNVVSVLGTCGNYSDLLQRTSIAKFCLGYITSLKDLPMSSLHSHLVNNASFTKTAAACSVKDFHLLVNREFWKLASKSIEDHHLKGVQMKVLGEGRIREMIPVFAFSVGDDPAQHLMCGIYQGNATRPCIQCTYAPGAGMMYDPSRHRVRNFPDLVKKCAAAEEILVRREEMRLEEAINSSKNKKKAGDKDKLKRKRFLSTPEDAEVLVSLKRQCVEPRVNAFHNTPMGVENNIYNMPADLFHVFCAGLMKHSVLWILEIINQIGISDPKYKDNSGTLDARLNSFLHVPELPHVPVTFFRKGLTAIASKKSINQRQNGTGSGGGYRSSHWITALLQFYFCIGHRGDILPNEPNYAINENVFGNPTAKVLKLIYSLLDVYFQCKQSSFTELQVRKLEGDIKSMNAHLTLLWDLKQAILNAPANKRMRIRKNHAVYHIPDAIRRFGALSKMNADRYEAFHQVSSTKPFKRVSKRAASLNQEMTEKSKQFQIFQLVDHIPKLLQDGLMYLESLKPRALPAVGTVCPVNGSPTYSLQLDSTWSCFEFVPQRRNYLSVKQLRKKIRPFVSIENFLSHPLLSAEEFFRRVRKFLHEQYDCWNRIIEKELHISLLSGVHFEGDDQSGVGAGNIYSTSCFHSTNRPRYDFVLVQTSEESLDLAQVLAFFKISNGHEHTIHAKEEVFFAIVAYLKEEKEKDCTVPKGRKLAELHFQRYMYDCERNARNRYVYTIDIIEYEAISGPAFVVPDFPQPTHSYPRNDEKLQDSRFTYVPRQFSDRSGWVVDESYSSGTRVDNVAEYLLAEATNHTAIRNVLFERREKSKKKKRGAATLSNENLYEINIDDAELMSEQEEEKDILYSSSDDEDGRAEDAYLR